MSTSASGKELFISYGREPEVVSFVTLLKHDLQKRGFSVWLDTEDIPAGCDWHAAIGTGLDQCKALIAVISNKYINSRYCKSELYTANGDQKLIFPVIIENVDFSCTERARGVKYVVSGINWTMFRPGYDDYQLSLDKLVSGMKEQGIGPGVDLTDSGSSDLSEKMAQLQVTPSAPPRSSSPVPNPGYSAPYPPPVSPANLGFQQTTPPSQYTTPPHPSHYPYPYTHYSHSPSPHGQTYPPYYTSPPHGYPPPTGYPQGQPYYPPPQTTGYPTYTPPVGGAPNEGLTQSPPPPYGALFTGSEPVDTSPLSASKATVNRPNFKVGMKLEAVDRRFPYFVCVATVMDRKEDKLMVHFDGWGPEYNYWCSRDSVELHPPGWCQKHKWELQQPLNQSWPGWGDYLTQTESEGATGDLFNENQLAGPESLLFSSDMRLEAKDRMNPSMICAATITQVSSGRVLIHFDGWGEEYDYWCEAESPDLHPAMWCGKNGRQVTAPNGYKGQFKWSEYLANEMINPAPAHLFTEEQLSADGRRKSLKPSGETLDGFQAGMKLEAKDRLNPTVVCVASIKDIKDGRLLIEFDGWSSKFDYWCKPTSTDIHPRGWCEANGRQLNPPRGYMESFSWDSYLMKQSATAAPESLFTKDQRAVVTPVVTPSARGSGSSSSQVKAGMKLEAKDRQNPHMICVATITEVKDGQLLIHFDGWSNNYDYWCEPTSPDIHPIGWCQANGHSLHSPRGHTGPFNWNSYLASTSAVAAPSHIFTQSQNTPNKPKQTFKAATGTESGSKFKAGMKLEAKDRKNPSLICVATITEVKHGQLLIHFDGWSNSYDYWCEPITTDIHPIGWCASHKHALQKPHGYYSAFSWDKYLKECRQASGAIASATPIAAFTTKQCQ